MSTGRNPFQTRAQRRTGGNRIPAAQELASQAAGRLPNARYGASRISESCAKAASEEAIERVSRVRPRTVPTAIAPTGYHEHYRNTQHANRSPDIVTYHGVSWSASPGDPSVSFVLNEHTLLTTHPASLIIAQNASGPSGPRCVSYSVLWSGLRLPDHRTLYVT